MLERRKEEDDETKERAYNAAISTTERLTAEIEREREARKAAVTEAEKAKSEAEHWRQQHELELECRLRTQGESDALRRELEQAHAEAKPSHLLAVAGLLELLLDRKRPHYDQGAASKAIGLRGWRGAGERQVNEVFADAKKVAVDARKEAAAKADAIKDSNAAPLI
jgi:phage-related tail protein